MITIDLSARKLDILRPMRLSSGIMYLVITLVCLNSAWAMDLTPYAKPNAPLAKADTDMRYALWHSVLVDAYHKRGDHDPKNDVEMEVVLDATAADIVGKKVATPDIRQAAERLAGLNGSTDPLAAFAWFRLSQNQGGQATNQACDKAMAAFAADNTKHPDKPRYANFLRAALFTYCFNTHDVHSHPEQMDATNLIAKQLKEAFVAAILAHEYDAAPSSLIRMTQLFSLQYSTEMSELFITDFGTAFETSKTDPWIGHTVLAQIGIDAAWAWRGSGWASSVTEEGWAGFKRHLDATEHHLTEAYRLHPGNPTIGTLGITLAGAGHNKVPMEEWFRRSLTACFDHSEAFNHYRSFATPRWGGTYDNLLDLGCAAVATKRFDTKVPRELLNTFTCLIRDARSMHQEAVLKIALGKPSVQKAMTDCVAGYIAKNPDTAADMHCWQAAYLWQIDDKKGARATLLAIDPPLRNASIGGWMGCDFEQILADTEPKKDITF